ncbi:MAG: FecR domain-containing protein [bacterium]|nr:FecR domain-containing protein [bacterium]
MKKNLFLSVITLVLFSFLLLGCSKEKAYRSIKIFSYKGTCNIIRNKKELDLAKVMKIKNNDELQVKEDSQAILKLDNDKFVCVKENTDVKFVATGKENNTKTRLHVNNGGVVVEVKEKLKDKESFEIASSNSVMAIRGTQISFDVVKTSDSITTTFSILTGNTETYLYKDETMNSTTLIHDKMMSYTTNLSKTTDEIFKLYDSFKPVEITDVDLKEKYNTEKLDITNEMIDEIVNATNEFERIDNKINKTIDFTISANVAYGANPIDSITISDDINEFVNVKYLFSQSLDGEFKEITDLELGKWYCKIIADNAYDSIVKEFNVVTAKKIVKFDINNEFDYGNTLLSQLTFNDSSIDFNENTDIKYRKSGETTFNTYDPSTILDAGTYYIKLEGSDYSSQSKEILINKLKVDFTLTESELEYGSNVFDYISGVDFSYSPYISNAIDGTYTLYNMNSSLNAGTYYIKLQGKNYYTDPKVLVISSIELEFSIVNPLDYGSLLKDAVTRITPTVESFDVYISNSIDGEFSFYNPTTVLEMGTYYIYITSGANYKSEIKEITISKIQAGFNYGKYAIYGNNTAGVKVIASCDKFFNSTYAKEKDDFGKYVYYVDVAYSLYGNDYTYRFDYDNRELVINDFGKGGSSLSEIEFTYTYNLPNVFEVTNNSNTETFTMAEGIEVISTNIGYGNTIEEYRISAKFNYYKLDEHNITAKYILSDSGYSWQNNEIYYDENTNIWHFDVSSSEIQNNTVRVYFVLVEGDLETNVVTFDVSNLVNPDDLDYTLALDNEPVKTLNSDGTVNIYKDLQFTDDSSLGLVYEIGYGKYVSSSETSISFTTKDVIRSANRFLILENLDNDSYAIRYINVIRVVDGIDYVVNSYSDYDFTDIDKKAITTKNVPVGISFDDTNYEGYEVWANNTYILPTDKNEMSVNVYYDLDPDNVYNYSFDNSSFGYDNHILLKLSDETDYSIELNYSFVEAMVINKELAELIFGETYENDVKITSENMFEQVSDYMQNEYGITISGTYFAERVADVLEANDN